MINDDIDDLKRLVGGLKDVIFNVEYEVDRLEKENSYLRMNTINNPENFTCMGYNLKDLVALAYKCDQCGITDVDLKKCANDFSLAHDIIWHEFDEALKHPFYDWKTGTVSIKVGGKKDDSEA